MQVGQATGSCKVLAPAKLNLLLEVLSRREDGYHEIETLMVPVDLYDSLSLEADALETVRLTCRWAVGLQKTSKNKLETSPAEAPCETTPIRDIQIQNTLSDYEELPEGSENIVVRAIELLRLRAGIRSGAAVRLTKRIPSAAGLGGGSSDAAAALVAANRVWQLRWSPRQLQCVAAEVGSDVPFFLGSGAAVCRGRGERIEPVAGVPALDFVVVAPPAGLSTADVYRGCRPAESPRTAEPLIDALRQKDLRKIAANLHNGLEPAAERLSRWIGRAKRDLAACGCSAVQMSGSGTSCFGICHDARQARRAARWMRGRGWSRSMAVRSTR